MYIAWLLIATIFVIWIIWLYTDPRPFRKRFSKKYLTVVFIELLVVIPQLISSMYFPFPQTSWDSMLFALGVSLFTAGVIMTVWAKLTMRKYWGPPGQHDISRQDKLLTHGPFSFTRNPIYLGMFFLAFGFAVALRSVFFFLPILMIFYFLNEIKKEERLLLHHFGDKYVRYSEKVPRFIGVGKISL